MPLIASSYKSPVFLPGRDMQTIVPALFRFVDDIHYHRERITTPDHDFLHLDWLKNNTSKIALIIHGLEANTHSAYMKGMAKTLFREGFTICAMNLRGCSGEVNNLARAYHSGSTDDLETVVAHILRTKECEELVIVGFSLGGNLILKYLGERGTSLYSQITKAVAISVPCDLVAGAGQLDRRLNFIYRDRFLKSLKRKLIERRERLPFPLTKKQVRKISSLLDFDNAYTSPMYGFRDAMEYYASCSSRYFIKGITVPTLILIAKNDPFLTVECLPYEECKDHPCVFLETPDEGGHVGFCMDTVNGNYYSENRVVDFLNQVVPVISKP